MNNIKKPKRDLRVKSIFQEAAKVQLDPSPFDVEPPLESPAPIERSVDASQMQITSQIKQSPLVQQEKLIINNNPSEIVREPPKLSQNHKEIIQQQHKNMPQIQTVPKTLPQKQSIIQPADSKKSKIQQLKLKYLKKNIQSSQQVPIKVQPPRIQPIKQLRQQKQFIQSPKELVTQPEPITTFTMPMAPTPLTNKNIPKSEHIETVPINQQKSDAYHTNFKQIIQQKCKNQVRPPIPPIKRQIGIPRDPFALKGTYPNPFKNQAQTSNHFYNEQHNTNVFEIPQKSHDQQFTSVPNQPNAPQYVQKTNLQQTTQTSFSPFGQTPAYPQSKHQISINYSNLISNPKQYINDLHQKGLISTSIYELCLQRLFEVPYAQTQLYPSSTNPQYNEWVHRMFSSLILRSPTVAQENHSLVNDLLNEFFMPLGDEFSPLFIIVLSKLSVQFYQKYQRYIFMNPLMYVQTLSTYKDYISREGSKQFLNFIINGIDEPSQNYCRIILTAFLISSETITDNTLSKFSQYCNPTEASILTIILNKRKQKFIKENIIIANIVIKKLEEKKQIETGLKLIQQLNHQLGTPAYALLKEIRERLIREFQEPQKQSDAINQAKNVASNLFGFFSNAMDKIINKQPEQHQNQYQHPQKQQKQQSKESIYFDHQKKRYVLNGQIPDDEEEVTTTPVQKEVAPPPLQSRAPPPPPPSSIPNGNINSSKRTNRMPVNRYV